MKPSPRFGQLQHDRQAIRLDACHPAPSDVRFANGELTWTAEADLESGLGGFIIERDGKEIARLPEKPVGKMGTPLFQGLSGGDTPIVAEVPMRFTDSTAKAGQARVSRDQREQHQFDQRQSSHCATPSSAIFT